MAEVCLKHAVMQRVALRPTGYTLSELTRVLGASEERLDIVLRELVEQGLIGFTEQVVAPFQWWDKDRFEIFLNIPKVSEFEFREYCAEIDSLVADLRNHSLPII